MLCAAPPGGRIQPPLLPVCKPSRGWDVGAEIRVGALPWSGQEAATHLRRAGQALFVPVEPPCGPAGPRSPHSAKREAGQAAHFQRQKVRVRPRLQSLTPWSLWGGQEAPWVEQEGREGPGKREVGVEPGSEAGSGGEGRGWGRGGGSGGPGGRGWGGAGE